jgi:hypothetical protein
MFCKLFKRKKPMSVFTDAVDPLIAKLPAIVTIDVSAINTAIAANTAAITDLQNEFTKLVTQLNPPVAPTA